MSNAPTPADSPERAEQNPPSVSAEAAAASAPVSGLQPEASETLIETEVSSDTATVRRAPKYGRFMTLGASLGAVVALVLTLSFTPEQSEFVPVGFDGGQVFGFLLLICASIGLALGAIVALAFDRALARRTTSVGVEHEVAHRVDETP
ncbi:potassium transporter Trk [Agromyces sp. NPDC058110]|uniref:potassium transporter Trk n=1 Tax=Agromyces sp. NPDC058110 TaxID=3346345 RepID=UPI0036DA0477